MTTPRGWMHVACTGVSVEHDVLDAKWIALIYAVMFVPVVQPISYVTRRALQIAWRERFPHRAAQLRVHGAIADLTSFVFMALLCCAFVLWIVSRLL
jgi:hypothetical protein